MTREECCGTCQWHMMQTRIVGAKSIYEAKTSSQVVNEWFCNNKRSNYYTDFTDYEDSCDEWEE